ncbi:helix-turn-helix domain-containing protein, partial [Zavarzinia sp.]|uniref:helix-turn-helix domain-containing protein n=1 Tax=Zavarzinia sp. TaxID=2027920 RepID=UPI003BB62555
MFDRLDLNLLRLFEAVLHSGSVSRAAQQLGLTQSAASNGLARLRDVLGDPLFIRRPGGVEPTARA